MITIGDVLPLYKSVLGIVLKKVKSAVLGSERWLGNYRLRQVL